MSNTSCCIYCGKRYKKMENLYKHAYICEYVSKSKSNKVILLEDTENIELPSQKQMYGMLLDLSKKYKKLEEMSIEQKKWIDSKKKKINIIEWLNNNECYKDCKNEFNDLLENMNILMLDIDNLLKNSFMDVLNIILTRNIYENIELPIIGLSEKINILYIYDKKYKWSIMSNDKLTYFLNKIHSKIVKILREWKSKNEEKLNTNDGLMELYNKGIVKLMNVDFKNNLILNKIKSNIYNNIKKNMGNLIEYEYV